MSLVFASSRDLVIKSRIAQLLTSLFLRYEESDLGSEEGGGSEEEAGSEEDELEEEDEEEVPQEKEEKGENPLSVYLV